MKKIVLLALCSSLFFGVVATSLSQESDSAAPTEQERETAPPPPTPSPDPPATPAAEPADADNPGLALLDQAIDEKLKGAGRYDPSKVIDLAQRAKKEGLSGTNLKFCTELIASEQLQRGLIMSRQIVDRPASKQTQGWEIARIRILNDLEEAVQVIKDQPLAYLQIAKLNLLPDGDAKRAAEALQLAETAGRNDPKMFAQIILLKAMLEKDPVKREALISEASRKSPDSQLLLIHAMSQIDLKQFDEALETLKKILEKDPDNFQALLATFEILANMEKYEEALKVLDVLEKEAPNDELTLQRARLLANLGRNDEAIKLLDELREKNPANVDVLAIRAAVYLDLQEWDKGLKDVDAALRLAPNQIRFLLLKIQFLVSLKRYEEATTMLEEMRKENPKNDELTILLVQILAERKQYRKALEYLNPILEKKPDNLVLLRLKSQLLISTNRHTEAVRTFEAILKADPDDEVSLNNLSWLLSTSPIDMVRDGRRALELAQKACELTEYKKAYILSTLAAAYAELGEFDKAVEWSEKSIALSAEDDNVKDRVGELKKELESYEKKRPYRESVEEGQDEKDGNE